MKLATMTAVLLTVFPVSAFAIGADLTIVACPGGAGATADAGALDCAGGATLTLLNTFMPAEASPDFAGIDCIWDLQVAGDVQADATFWDFGGANAAALGSSHVRPTAPGCSAYFNTWQPSGSGSGTLGQFRSPSIVRIYGLCYRPTGLAYNPNQKMWGIQLTIDASTSEEAGGTVTGCTKGVCLILNEIQPRTISGFDGQDLTSASVFGNQATVNGVGSLACCGVSGGARFSIECTPVKAHTWGQLKSLYR